MPRSCRHTSLQVKRGASEPATSYVFPETGDRREPQCRRRRSRDHEAGGRRQLGPEKQSLADADGDFLLRDRDDGDRRFPVRRRSFWRGGVPFFTPAGGSHDCVRDVDEQDGPGRPVDVELLV